jgi:hypothetical protein
MAATRQAGPAPRRSPRPQRAGSAAVEPQSAGAGPALLAVTAAHTLVWFSIESCMVYVLYAGLANRTDRRAAIAAAVIAAESLVFAANGFRCPLTDVAESLGAEHGSVTDIYLPARFARNLPAIHVPLLALALFLHGRNLRRSFGAAPLAAPAQLRRQAGSRALPLVTEGFRAFWHG